MCFGLAGFIKFKNLSRKVSNSGNDETFLKTKSRKKVEKWQKIKQEKITGI